MATFWFIQEVMLTALNMKFAIKSESTTPPGVLNQHTVGHIYLHTQTTVKESTRGETIS